MSEFKGTPGPWTIRRAKVPIDGAFDYAIGATSDGKSSCIAEAFGRTDWHKWPDAEANARLIAAAPDLLAALQALIWATEGVMWYVGPNGNEAEPEIDQANAAIAKALGEDK